MSKHVINHNALTHLIEAGAITSATASADGDIWTLSILSGETDKIMMAKNSGKPRVWRKLDTLAKYLQTLGLNKFEIDLTNYNPKQKSLRRPDSAVTLKRTHQARKSQIVDDIIRNPKTAADSGLLEKTKEKWEERRARILAEENPRVK